VEDANRSSISPKTCVVDTADTDDPSLAACLVCRTAERSCWTTYSVRLRAGSSSRYDMSFSSRWRVFMVDACWLSDLFQSRIELCFEAGNQDTEGVVMV